MTEYIKTMLQARVIGRRAAHCALLLAVALVALPSPAQDSFPSKPIRMIVSVGAGGAGDTLTRRLAERLSRELKTPVLVENMPGGSGVIAAQAVARAAPDGHTLMVGTSTSHALNASTLKNMPYDPVNDFEPITRMGTIALVMGVNNSVPASNLRDFVAYAKANPGKIAFGSGTGSARLASEMLKAKAGIDMISVPYKSNAQALTDLRSGQIQMILGDLTLMLPHIRTGTIKGFGVTSSRRSGVMPEMPTMDEAGVASFELVGFIAAFAPAKTPEPIVRRLNAEMVKILSDKEFASGATALGVDAAPTSPAELRELVISETRKWGELARAAGMQPE